jgi:hypothetical protein
MSEHRVSVLSVSLSRHPDPTRSRDPRVQAVLAELKTLTVAPPPRAHFRAELRAQLVAVAPRLVAEGAAAEAPLVDIAPRPSPIPKAQRVQPQAPARHTDRDGVLARLRRLPIGRPLAIAATVVTAFALLLAGAVVLSKKALPGDALYGLKRASEQVELATASNDQEKARYYLEFAATRANEAKSLLGRSSASALGVGPHASGGVNAHTAKLVTSTLASADSDVRSASRLLGTQAVHNSSAKPLGAMIDFAPGQLRRLQQIAAAIPAGELRTRADTSARLVSAALVRATALQSAIGCSCLKDAPSDELGPIPCTSCGSIATPPKGTGTTGHRAPKPSGKPASTTGVPNPVVTAPNPQPSGSTSPNKSSTGINLPSLPVDLPTTGLPSVPIDINTCSATINLGIIQVGIGSCPSS